MSKIGKFFSSDGVICKNYGSNYFRNAHDYQGLPYDKIVDIRRRHLNPAIKAFYKKPLLIHKARMQYVYDHENKRYLDCLGGIVTISVGHCHPEVNEAVKKQMDNVWHTTNIYLHEPIHKYVEKLVKKMTGKLDNVYLVNSGSEANDLALMMARIYTKNMEVISLRNSYHGLSASILSIMNMGSWKHKHVPNFAAQATMNPDPYRGLWGGSNCRDSPVQVDRECHCEASECKASDMYVNQLEDLLKHSVPKNGVAAFIVESIQGAGGTVQYPKGFVKRAFQLIHQYGGICIADEVQTGFGRTGEHFWGYEMHDAQPDMVIMAKGMANGFPMAALVTKKEIAQSLDYANHFNTFGGNPLACTAASTVLDIIDREKLQQNSLEVGTYLLKKLAMLRDKFSIVGDVRGKGLMIGIEFVENKETKQPLNATRMMDIMETIKDNGLLVGKGGFSGTVMRIKPPMCINKQDADFAVETIEKSLK